MLISFIDLLVAFSGATLFAEGLDSIIFFQQDAVKHSEKVPGFQDGDMMLPPKEGTSNKPMNGQRRHIGFPHKSQSRQYPDDGDEEPQPGVWQLPVPEDSEQYKITQVQIENNKMDQAIQAKEGELKRLLSEITLVQKQRDDMEKNITWYEQNKEGIQSWTKDKLNKAGGELMESESRLLNVTGTLKKQLQMEGMEESNTLDTLSHELSALALNHGKMQANASAMEKQLVMFSAVRSKNEAMQASLVDHSPYKVKRENILVNAKMQYDNVSSLAGPLREEVTFLSAQLQNLQTVNARLKQSYTDALDAIGELSSKIIGLRDPLSSV